MTTIMPDDELLRKAVRHIDTALKEEESKPLAVILEEAAQRYNLGPAACEYLQDLFKDCNRKP